MMKKLIDNFLQPKTKLQGHDDWQNKRQEYIYLFQIYSTSLTWQTQKVFVVSLNWITDSFSEKQTAYDVNIFKVIV